MSDNTGTSTIGRVRSSILTTAEHSRILNGGKKVLDPLRDTSRSLTTYTRESYIYRWLTTEPDPEVVVIDLRETYAVGPVIRLLDSVITAMAPWWHESRVARLLHRTKRAADRAMRTPLGQKAQRLLEPPTPPGEDEEGRR